jgi:hypothetical protein
MNELFHWLFLGNGEETFLSLWTNGPHIMWELSMNVIEFLLVFLIFRPVAKLWYAHVKKQIHAELDTELGIEHGSDHGHGVRARVDNLEGL